ncbi:MAG TPA: hypothetical protein DCQ64_31660 [Candidatus Rokubacteria bacterium]|nr:hypothetical protein [Candidatus Rokubacteria bacterium]
MKHQIGSHGWWCGEARWAMRGIHDSILRLFEQGAITRSKARELLQYGAGYPTDPVPKAPWDELNWLDAARCDEE